MNEKVVSGESIAEAVNAANLFREKYGADKLVDLPQAIIGDSRNCVLAKAFNFDCMVSLYHAEDFDGSEKYKDSDGDIWSVIFYKTEIEKADALYSILKTHMSAIGLYIHVVLPPSIGEIANQFDNMNLSSEYYTINEDGYIVNPDGPTSHHITEL